MQHSCNSSLQERPIRDALDSQELLPPSSPSEEIQPTQDLTCPLECLFQVIELSKAVW